MSAPLSRKNLPENPTPDDILNAFLDYLTATGHRALSATRKKPSSSCSPART